MRSSTHWLGQTVVTSVGRKWRKVINIPFPWRAGLDLTCQLECGAINSVSLHSAKTWSQTNSLGTFVTLHTSLQLLSGFIACLGLPWQDPAELSWSDLVLGLSWMISFCCRREQEFNVILTPGHLGMQDIIVLDLTRIKRFTCVCCLPCPGLVETSL